MANEGNGGQDPVDEYDRKHGDPVKGKDHVPVNLSEGQNKPPPQDVPFKITNAG